MVTTIQLSEDVKNASDRMKSNKETDSALQEYEKNNNIKSSISLVIREYNSKSLK